MAPERKDRMVTKFMVRFRALAVRFICHLVALEPITTIIGRRAYVVNPKTGYLVPSVAGASPDDGGDDGGDGDDKGDDAKDDAAGDKSDDADDDDSADDDDDGKKDEPDWKRMSRKHEREAKKAAKERDDLAKKLKDREDADKTEHQKAVDAAKEEGRTEAQTAADKDRRHDRLESSAIRLAARGVEIEVDVDGEKKTKTVKFDDPDDALVFLERDMRNGDLDEDDLFDSDGKVQSDKLEEALSDLLARKPKLRADSGSDDGKGKGKKVEGGADGGKGGGDAKSEPTTTDDHFKAIRRTKPA